MKVFRVLPVLAVLGAAVTVQADVAPEKKSTLTISTPVEVPGVTLDPGTYVVKLVDTMSNRNIVTIMNVDENKVFATAIATPHVAATDPKHTTFVFYPTPDGATKVLRTWYAPNDRYGQDFVYAPARAAALRQMTNAEVPALTAEQSRELEVRSAPAPVAVVSDAEPVPAPAPPPPPAPAPVAMTADASSSLPATASHTPLLFAAGLAALALAAALRFSGRS